MTALSQMMIEPVDPTRAALFRIALVMSVYSVVVGVGLAAAAVRFGRRATWKLCSWLAGLLALGWWITAAASWPAILHPVWSAVYMIVLLAAVPLALTTAVVNRSVAKHSRRTLAGHAVRGWIAFILGVVLAVVLGVIPDFVVFMRQNGGA